MKNHNDKLKDISVPLLTILLSLLLSTHVSAFSKNSFAEEMELIDRFFNESSSSDKAPKDSSRDEGDANKLHERILFYQFYQGKEAPLPSTKSRSKEQSN